MKSTEVTHSLNAILANMHVLNAKLHNFHWNVFGMQFHSIHKTTEAYYDYFFKQFDDVAERILQLGAKPAATVKCYLELATIKEDEGSRFEPAFVLENVVADFTILRDQAKAVVVLAEKDGDLGTLDLLGGLIAWLEKEIWLTKSALGK